MLRVLSSAYCTVQEGQTVSSDIFPCELDVIIHNIHMLCEGFDSSCSDFDPGVIHIPEPVARSSSGEGHPCSTLLPYRGWQPLGTPVGPWYNRAPAEAFTDWK